MFELNDRNKRALIILLVFLIPFLLINFIYIPYTSEIELLNKRVDIKKKQFHEMLSLENEVKLYKKVTNSKPGSNKIRNFSLYTFIYTLSGKSGIKENISYIKPSSFRDNDRGIDGTLVEIEFKSVPMDLFTRLLFEIENSGYSLNIKKLSIIKTGTGNSSINIIMHIESVNT